MPAKHQPDRKYLRYVNTKRVHLFTLIQLVSTAGLYLIKFIEQVAILFPVLVSFYKKKETFSFSEIFMFI